MKVLDVVEDRVVIQLGEHSYRLTLEQIALLVRHAYWRLDMRSAGYLARIISDALIEPPIETDAERLEQQRFYMNEVARGLRKAIRAHNPPVGQAQESQPAATSEETRPAVDETEPEGVDHA